MRLQSHFEHTVFRQFKFKDSANRIYFDGNNCVEGNK